MRPNDLHRLWGVGAIGPIGNRITRRTQMHLCDRTGIQAGTVSRCRVAPACCTPASMAVRPRTVPISACNEVVIPQPHKYTTYFLLCRNRQVQCAHERCAYYDYSKCVCDWWMRTWCRTTRQCVREIQHTVSTCIIHVPRTRTSYGIYLVSDIYTI